MKLKLFFIGMLLVTLTLTACNNQNGDTQYNSTNEEVKGDWKALSLKELNEEADLFVFASVKDTERKEKVMV
jgi:hypothetical protein